ncbi:MAG: glycosyltransferase [Candidatus Bathyarchaeia archaeon]
MQEIITIGIPSKNRILTIDRVLESISSQTYPKDKIKIVFVDESNDGTYEKLLQWKKQNENTYLEIKIINDYKSNGYISALRNLCIANMTGEVMFFWDSDVVAPDNESLSRVLMLLQDDSVGAAGLPYYTDHPSLYERTMQGEAVVNAMGFTAIKKCVFVEVGLFNEKLKLQEDTDLLARIRSHGLKVSFDTSTPGLHLKPNTVRPSFSRGLSNYGFQLRYRLTKESTLVDGLIKTGSKAHLLRMLYYFALPILVVLWLINFAVPIVPVLVFTILVAAYILLNLAYQVWKTKKNRLMGVVTFFYVTPMGIASYYGYVLSRLKHFFKRSP